jgi:hypothetical protein
MNKSIRSLPRIVPLLLVATAAQAQDDPDQPMQEVVVTGSRIIQSSANSQQPISIIDRAAIELGAAGKEIDAVLDRAIDGRIRRAGLIVDDLERVLERHLKRREDIAHAQFQRVRNLLLPGGTPQERILSAGGVHAVHGAEWLDAATEQATAWARAAVAAGR